MSLDHRNREAAATSLPSDTEDAGCGGLQPLVVIVEQQLDAPDDPAAAVDPQAMFIRVPDRKVLQPDSEFLYSIECYRTRKSEWRASSRLLTRRCGRTSKCL